MANKADPINFTSSRFRDFCQTNVVSSGDSNNLVDSAQHDHSLHQPISHAALTRLDHVLNDNHIPAADSSNEKTETRPAAMKCCCGRPECAYLEHNNAALGGLERDLETAARLGQALLDRHEAYVKESQAEQARLSGYITDLEHEKASLQDANQKIVVENRELLQKLEELNTDFGESGRKVQDLENLLQDCEQEIRRLNGLTRMTQELELKMLDMERERADLNKSFADSRDEARSTMARWKESERKIRELEDEVRRIELAARLDREKHEEIVARMQKDQNIERELGLSEGRLKATAAVNSLKSNGPREKQVVSNFVRDILQDNAGLQAGIAELRDLLQSSNDEVQNLREQVMLHQSVIGDENVPPPHRSVSLSDELGLGRSPPKQVQQELHVHHHYHPKVGSKKERTPLRRSSRRRALMPSTLSGSPSTSGVSTPLVRPERFESDLAMPLNIRTDDPKSNRWSMQSTATSSTYMSSMASSPRSYFERNSSIFDRIERDEESSRPTSPDSFTISSPMPFKRKSRPDEQALSVFEEEDVNEDLTDLSLLPKSPERPPTSISSSRDDSNLQSENNEDVVPELELTPKPSISNKLNLATSELLPQRSDPYIPEPTPPPDLAPVDTKHSNPASDLESQSPLPHKQEDKQIESDTSLFQIPEIRPSIRRRNSHDSLLSISGMDIHLAQNTNPRSALALLRGTGANKHYFAPSPSSTRKVIATQPLASVTEYTAISRPGLDNTPSASMVALSGIRNTDHVIQATPTKGLIGSVGGWVRGKWGVAPTKSVSDLRSTVAVSPNAKASMASYTPHRPSVNHAATAPITVKSSAVSQHSVATTSTTNSKSSTGQRSVSTNSLTVPTSTPSISISPQNAQDSTNLLASSFFGGRTAGINQSGPIPGFAAAVAAKKAPTEIQAKKVDVNILKESLGEG